MAAITLDEIGAAREVVYRHLAPLLRERQRMAGRKVGLILTGGDADKALFARALGRG